MNKIQKRIKIAEACGWYEVQANPLTKGERSPQLAGRHYPTGPLEGIPDYFDDLNAMHAAWKEYFGLYSEEWLHAHSHLKQVVASSVGEEDMDDPYVMTAIANATAEQRAEAFGLTLGLWE